MELLSRFTPKLLIFVLTIFLATYAFTPPLDPDLGWHFRYGAEITNRILKPNHKVLEPGQAKLDPAPREKLGETLLNLDQFNQVFGHYNYQNYEWLSEVLYYFVYKHFWLWGLVFLNMVVVGLSFVLPLLVFKNTSNLAKLLTLSLGLSVSWPVISFGARPQLFTILTLSLSYFIIYRFKMRNKDRHEDQKSSLSIIVGNLIFVLPVILGLLTSLHPGFSAVLASLIIITLAEALETMAARFSPKLSPSPTFGINSSLFDYRLTLSKSKILKMLLVTLLALLAALIAGPYGANPTFYYIKGLFTGLLVKSHNPGIGEILEWTPINLNTEFGALVLTSILAWIFTALYKVKAGKAHIFLSQFVLAAAFTLLTYTARRHLPLYAVVIMPIICEGLSDVIESLELRPKVGLEFFAAVSFLLFLSLRTPIRVISALNLLKNESSFFLSNGSTVKALEWVEKNHPAGNLFNLYDWGGFIDWQAPELKGFIDGRMPGWHQGNDFIFNDYLKAFAGAEGFEKILEKYQIAWTFLPPNAPLNTALSQKKDWEVTYQDDQVVIYQMRKMKI